jgi:hypothetical protein
MATYKKFEDFVEQLGKGIHHLHAAGDELRVCLLSSAPASATDAYYTTTICGAKETKEQNNYSTSGDDAQNDYTEAGGVGTMTCQDIVFSASGGSIGGFQYAVLYNKTATNGPLIAWWDYGSSVTAADTETFTVNFGASVLTIT